jgi:hypothetical protein
MHDAARMHLALHITGSFGHPPTVDRSIFGEVACSVGLRRVEAEIQVVGVSAHRCDAGADRGAEGRSGIGDDGLCVVETAVGCADGFLDVAPQRIAVERAGVDIEEQMPLAVEVPHFRIRHGFVAGVNDRCRNRIAVAVDFSHLDDAGMQPVFVVDLPERAIGLLVDDRGGLGGTQS